MPRIAILLASALIVAPGAAQQSPGSIVIGDVAEIDSVILDELRRVYVGIPQSYDDSQSYGVLYVLDGETQFQHTQTTARFLGGMFVQKIPPLLVVAIENTDRMRDMTPPSDNSAGADTFVAQGGADRFLRFIEEELRPWVDERYRTSGYDVLVGHSLGGLLALHALVSEPSTFDAYIALDASLWWDDQSVVREAAESMPGRSGIDSSLFLAVSGEASNEHEPLSNFVNVLQTGEPNGLRWIQTPIVSESHETLPLPGIYQGLQWVFADWDIEAEARAQFGDAPGEDIMARMDDLYARSGERFGVDRTTPYVVFESLLSFLAINERLDEAAALTLRYADRYPLPLVPNVISGIASLYVESGNPEAAAAYLSSVLEIYPEDETASRVLDEIVDATGHP